MTGPLFLKETVLHSCQIFLKLPWVGRNHRENSFMRLNGKIEQMKAKREKEPR